MQLPVFLKVYNSFGLILTCVIKYGSHEEETPKFDRNPTRKLTRKTFGLHEEIYLQLMQKLFVRPLSTVEDEEL